MSRNRFFTGLFGGGVEQEEELQSRINTLTQELNVKTETITRLEAEFYLIREQFSKLETKLK
jgi:predicted nuclease with TOPRIM domain